MYLLDRLLENSRQLTLTDKLKMCNWITKPIGTYGLELRGSTEPSHSYKVVSLQFTMLYKITDSAYYVSNYVIHNDLLFSSSRYKLFLSEYEIHPNPVVRALFVTHIPGNPRRRSNWKWPRDFLGEQNNNNNEVNLNTVIGVAPIG